MRQFAGLLLLLLCEVVSLALGQALALSASVAEDEAPFNATHGRARALQLNSCGAHPVERYNQRFGVGNRDFNRLLCDGGAGISYDLTVRTNRRDGGDRLA